MRLLLTFTLLALTGLSACRPQPAPGADSAAEVSVWMVQTFSGGQQCQPHQTYSPPNVVADLAREGVDVMATEVERLSVCQACTCPAYAARHYVQIRAADVAKAEALGYERTEAPPAE